MLHAVKSVWGNENRRDSEGKHQTAAGERRTKRTKLIAAKDVQSSVSPSPKKKPYTAFPPCSGVGQTAAVIKRASRNFHCCGSRKATNHRKKIIRVPDGNLNALICLN